MTEKKKKRVIHNTPVGVTVWPKLSEPDYGSNDYPKPDGEFSTKLRLPEGDPTTQALIKLLQPEHDEAVAQAEAAFKEMKVATRKKLGKVTVNDLFATVYDEETEEPTGDLDFKFAVSAGGTYKKGPKAGQSWSRSMPIFDAKSNPLVRPPSIWGGTEGIVAFSVAPYFIAGTGAAGLKLYLEGFQIISLVSEGMKSADQLGFGAQAGYVHQDAPDAEAAEAEGDDAGGDDDEQGDF
jgi:hypothetical protein